MTQASQSLVTVSGMTYPGSWPHSLLRHLSYQSYRGVSPRFWDLDGWVQNRQVACYVGKGGLVCRRRGCSQYMEHSRGAKRDPVTALGFLDWIMPEPDLSLTFQLLIKHISPFPFGLAWIFCCFNWQRLVSRGEWDEWVFLVRSHMSFCCLTHFLFL